MKPARAMAARPTILKATLYHTDGTFSEVKFVMPKYTNWLAAYHAGYKYLAAYIFDISTQQVQIKGFSVQIGFVDKLGAEDYFIDFAREDIHPSSKYIPALSLGMWTHDSSVGAQALPGREAPLHHLALYYPFKYCELISEILQTLPMQNIGEIAVSKKGGYVIVGIFKSVSECEDFQKIVAGRLENINNRQPAAVV